MDLFVSWVLFPALMLVVLTGCGLLVRTLVGVPLGGALLPGIGLALLVCVAHLTTAADATAELTTPVIVALAAGGYLGSRRLDWRGAARAAAPAAVAAAGVFLVYGAPMILSGEATFAGYIKLDDTATWLALTDRVMEHGRSLDGLAPSTYEATLAVNLGDGYPVGAFLPLGVGSQLIASDAAWAIQPYMALLAALLAASMTEIARPLVPRAALRAGLAFVAAQPALLIGFVLWGGIKEIEAAMLVALAAALVPVALGRSASPVRVLPLALALAALLAVLSLGGVVWVLPILGVPLLLLWRRSGRGALVDAAVFGGFSLLFLAPLVAGGELLPPTSSPLTSSSAKGNLLEPLSVWQVFGIWPVGDFRLRPGAGLLTGIVIAAAVLMSVLGGVVSWRRQAVAAELYVGSTVLACAVLVLAGSPWVDGKALATAAPALLFAAALGVAELFRRGMGATAVLAAGAIAGGVLVSNVLAFRAVNLAPRDQLAELERIGEDTDGQGPTLMTEYNPYGVRHFLRASDPEGASELRRRVVPLRDGSTLEKGFWADSDALDLNALLTYRTLVLRRSPAQSRPPLLYRLVSSDDYYEVWQRPSAPATVVHLPLGGPDQPGAAAPCSEVRRLARQAGPGGSLAFAERPPNLIIAATDLQHPDSWSPEEGTALLPRTEGAASTAVELPRAGAWTIWLGGSLRARIELRVDGRSIGSARHLLNNHGLYTELGEAELDAGLHTLELRYGGADFHPGSGGLAPQIGPLVLSPTDSGDEQVELIAASRATELCGKQLDWMEALPADTSVQAKP